MSTWHCTLHIDLLAQMWLDIGGTVADRVPVPLVPSLSCLCASLHCADTNISVVTWEQSQKIDPPSQ